MSYMTENRSFYAIILGAIIAPFSLIGYETAGHLAEETINASTNSPKGIIYAYAMSVFIGLYYIIGMLFALGG
jgi:amino acid transporter